MTDGDEVKPYPKGRRQRVVPLLQWMVDELEVPEPRACGLKHRGRRGCPFCLLLPTLGGHVRDDRNFSRRVRYTTHFRGDTRLADQGHVLLRMQLS